MIKNLISLFFVILLISGCAKNGDFDNLANTADQQLITTGPGVFASEWATKINANIGELYGNKIVSGTVSGGTMSLVKADDTTVEINVESLQNTDSQTITALSLDEGTGVLSVTLSGGNTATVDLSNLVSSSGATIAELMTADLNFLGNLNFSDSEGFITGPIGFMSDNESGYYAYIEPTGLSDYRPISVGDYPSRIPNSTAVNSDGSIPTSSMYVATPWPYSNSPCTPGEYAFTTDKAWKLECIESGVFNRIATSIWTDSADPTTYALTFTAIGDSTYTIAGAVRTAAGSPYTISGLSGVVPIVATYGGTDNAITFSGTNGADVTGSYPNYSLTMDAAKAVTATSTVPPPVGTYADIFLYTGFNSITTVLDKGTGYITWSSNMLLNTATPITGAGSLNNNNANYARTLVTDAAIDWENLNMLVKFRPKEISSGEVVYCSDQTLKLTSTGTTLYLTYKDKTVSYVHGFIGDGSTAYAINIKTTATTATLLVDGVQKLAITGASGTAPVGHIRLGATVSQWDGEWDQLILSNSASRDLNAVKNITDFN